MLDFLRRKPWSLDSLERPWGELKSIYEHLREGGGEPLPDEEIVFNRELRWVGGAMDGVLGSGLQGSAKEKKVFAIVSSLQRLQQRTDNKALTDLYKCIVEDGIVNCIDAVLKELRISDHPNNQEHLAEIGRYFATRAGHREAVKFGVALIGAYGDISQSELLTTLGICDEFTLFAGLALARVSHNPEQALWELAKKTQGWGRVQMVRRLADTQDPDIQSWMLREGFRNEVMDEYLACICARAGKLDEVLNHQFVDPAVVDAAAGLISAMIAGGPAENIDDYERAVDACECYLNIVWSKPDLGVQHFLTVTKLSQFLGQTDRWEERTQKGWTDSRRNSMRVLAEDVVRREHWRPKILEALKSEDERTFFAGDEAAQVLSIDTWEIHFSKVRNAPLTSSSWWRLMRQTNESRIDEVLRFAESALPLNQIETGPSDENGAGTEFQSHRALDWVLQDLRKFPGRGWRMIRAGLRSPVVRNRNMAIRALSEWNPNSWSTEMRSQVEQARDMEPSAEVKERLAALLDLVTPKS